jgi:hypothetical protein
MKGNGQRRENENTRGRQTAPQSMDLKCNKISQINQKHSFILQTQFSHNWYTLYLKPYKLCNQWTMGAETCSVHMYNYVWSRL